MKSLDSKDLTKIGLAIAINIIGTFLVINLKIPILLLDSIGTILISILLGPVYGIMTGILSSIVSGMTFDIFSIYFAPVQIVVGGMAGYMHYKNMLFGKKKFLGVFFISIISSITGAMIAFFAFDGITSSSSTYLVIFLKSLGVGKFLSVFIIQFIMDYLDRFIAVYLAIKLSDRLKKM